MAILVLRASERKAGLARDERGLSTMEYAVLFVVIIVGAIVLWSALGDSLAQHLGDGEETFEEVLGGHNPGGGSASPGSSGGGTASRGRTRTPLAR